MAAYQCYDQFGALIVVFEIEVANQKETIIKYDGHYYKPIIYDFINKIVRCVPVEVVEKTKEDILVD